MDSEFSKSLFLPYPVSGLTWKWMRATDIDDVFSIIEQIEAKDNPPYRTTRDEVEQLFEQTKHWIGIIATDEIGRCCAFVHARLRISSPLQIRCNGGIIPRYRGYSIGTQMIIWQESAARFLTRSIGTDSEVQIVCRNEYHDSAYSDLLLKAGYTSTSTFHEMRADLDVLPTAENPGPMIEITAWNPALEDMVRRAALEFAPDAVHSKGRSMEQWMSNRNRFAPELSFIAVDKSTDRTQIAGFLMAAKYPQDWEVLGWKEGYIDLLEVGVEWRNLPVGRELVVASMRASEQAGMNKIATGVSSRHEASAARLFGNLGFVEVSTQQEFTRTL
ncbi:GNAT family N-acetyltransferase [Boudabousia marimammalium]|uniref:N-acetyltransferase domain-containing protein n=1 Tax=Boudabousia marimammalium TaxID=156892 RepID=A0A1Q5PR21_9ACTO|nr:GNAT family N-acetyltransferase [Boudabousia marimammalium]OKL49943.1 hypothetical protein BM477_03295 [Boudabousia marimammalium]